MTVEYTFIDGIYTAIFRGEGTLINGTNLLNEATAAVIEGYSVIGKDAFFNATGLTSIVIPASVTSIGFGAFENAIGLTSINIPASVTSIEDFAFANATGLTSITFTGLSTLTSIGRAAFVGTTGLTSINIPASVTSIGDFAFANATGLTSITFTGLSTLTSIGRSAFNRTGLTSINIPASVTSIGYFAFVSSSLQSINVDQNNLNYLSLDGVLFNKDKTILIQYPGGKKTDLYVIPASVTSIGPGAFYGATGLTSINIPESVTSIGRVAFENAIGLTSINIPASVTSIGDFAFVSSSLQSINVDQNNLNYSSIDGVLFNKDKTILIQYPGGKKTDLYVIPASVISIGIYAFENATGLTSINIPESVTSIGDFAFFNATGLTSIVIPASVTSIGQCAFTNSGITRAYLTNPNGLYITTFNTQQLFYGKENVLILEIIIPTAIDQQVNTLVNNNKTITLDGTSVSGQPLTYTITSLPKFGVLEKVSDRVYNYRTDTNNQDYFQFTVTEMNITSLPGTVVLHNFSLEDIDNISRTQGTFTFDNITFDGTTWTFGTIRSEIFTQNEEFNQFGNWRFTN